MKKPAVCEVDVSSHALVRFMERVRGFCFEAEIAAIKSICYGVRDGTVKFNGFRYEISNGRVVTITEIAVCPSNTAKRYALDRLEHRA